MQRVDGALKNKACKLVARSKRPELVVIVGPTASGKSDLAIRVAKNYDGEIIAADSRTVYRGMDIGTAKPSKTDQKQVPHWGLDLVEPGQRFTVYQFQQYAKAKIKDIRNRGKLPILVGGTGLYIDAVLFDFGFLPDADLKKRTKLEKLSVEKLQNIIDKEGYQMPANFQNPRHLIRAIETKGKCGTKETVLSDKVFVVGIMPPDDILKGRINERVERIFAGGIVKEVHKLLKSHGENALKHSGGIIYKICLRLINGEINLVEAGALDKIADWQYARRQRTWFKRNPYIKWFGNSEQAFDFVKRSDLPTNP
jgi:tRNA dimethylallyltransferase